MFVKTFRLHRPMALVLVAVLACGMGLGAAHLLGTTDIVTVSTASVTDNAGRIAYLSSFGWQVEDEPHEILEIVIPYEFDAVYEQYNQLQLSQGNDLTRWKGMTAKRYTYRITNYPNSEDEVFANLIICREQIIAGDVSSLSIHGFMHGLAYERQ